MSYSTAQDKVKSYYTDRIKSYGPTHKGVDWNSKESQELRFAQLLKACGVSRPFSINDYGCGYGALVEYMAGQGYIFTYHGFDISEEMVKKAKELHSGFGNCEFCSKEACLNTADYTIASGIFNVKLETDNREWTKYTTQILERLSELSKNGFSFNMLTKYSDAGLTRPDLYYGDPCYFFDYCKRNFSGDVALLHDYGLYEFTILVRK